MAHKGKIWEVRQDGRIYSGQSIWPRFPAKEYIFELAFWQGAPTGMPTSEMLLKPHENTRSALAIEWRTDVIVADSQEVEVLLWCWADGSFTKPFFQMQVLLNGDPQYAEEIWEGWQMGVWEFMTANFVFPAPTIIGSMAIGDGSDSILSAVKWP